MEPVFPTTLLSGLIFPQHLHLAPSFVHAAPRPFFSFYAPPVFSHLLCLFFFLAKQRTHTNPCVSVCPQISESCRSVDSTTVFACMNDCAALVLDPYPSLWFVFIRKELCMETLVETASPVSEPEAPRERPSTRDEDS